MFSGIVEECAVVTGIVRDRENCHFTLTCSFVNELKIDQSVSHNGVCLTVVDIKDDTYTVTAMKETLERSNLGLLTEKKDAQGSWYFTFHYESDKEMVKRGYFTVDKGSVTVNGVSLTVCNPTRDTFQVAIIPYTYENTNFSDIQPGSVVNLEFDILGKYICRMEELK